MSEVEQTVSHAKRSPGRPPNKISDSVGVKKGVTSWTPANVSEVSNKEPGFRYRWARKDKDNVAKKQLENWEIVNAVNAPETHAEPGYGRLNDGKALTSTQERNDSILMRIPEEIAQLRDDYYNNEASRRVQGLTAHLKKEMGSHGGNAPVHGEIKLSSRKGTQIIE